MKWKIEILLRLIQFLITKIIKIIHDSKKEIDRHQKDHCKKGIEHYCMTNISTQKLNGEKKRKKKSNKKISCVIHYHLKIAQFHL